MHHGLFARRVMNVQHAHSIVLKRDAVMLRVHFDRILRTRDETWQEETEDGNPAKRTLGLANLGGATLDNEENYLIKKLMTGLGIVQVENQARI